MRGTTRWIALLLALALVAAACGDDDDGSAFGAGGDSDDSIEAFCDLAQQLEDLDASVNGGEVNIFEPDEIRPAFNELVSLTERAAEIAPDEVSDDFAARVESLGEIRDALDDVDFDFTAVDESLLADSDEEAAAQDRVESFIERECGISDSEAELSEEQIQEQAEDAGVADGLVAEAFVEAGLEPGQANCLADSISFEQLIELGESADNPPAEFFDALDACGVSLEQLVELGAMGGDDLGDMDLGEELGEESVEDLLEEMPDVAPSTGGSDLPPEAIDLFVSELVRQGFTEDEARCLAGPILEDPANADPLQAFEDCGISLSRLAELGG